MSRPQPIDPSAMTQAQLVALCEAILSSARHQHRRGSYEREAYEGALAMLGMFPHQSWPCRKVSAFRKRLAERRMKRMRQDREPAGGPEEKLHEARQD